MGYFEYQEKLESLKFFIKNRSAADVDSLSQKLNVSRRTVLRMVDLLKLQGVDIKFCKKQKIYLIKD